MKIKVLFLLLTVNLILDLVASLKKQELSCAARPKWKLLLKSFSDPVCFKRKPKKENLPLHSNVRRDFLGELSTWLLNMKNMWSDFPVYIGQESGIKLLTGCHQGAKYSEKIALENGVPNGRGIVTFAENSDCLNKLGIKIVNGTFQGGLLEGMATIHYANNSILRAPFHKGELSGISRVFTCPFTSCDFNYESWNKPSWLSQVSFFNHGRRSGIAWEFKTGGGAIVGKVDSAGSLTGNEIVYSYPDFQTVLAGKFQNGVMMAAKESVLTGIKFDKVSTIPSLIYDRVLHEKTAGIFKFDEATRSSISSQPLLQDPFEKKMVYVAKSKVEGAGYGAFSRRAAKKGALVGLYNGVKMQTIEVHKDAKDRRSQYRIDNDWAVSNEVIDIPPNFRSVQNYTATLGHILNHSPEPNAWYGMIDHPRFGKIRSIVLLKDVQADEELFCDYGYLDRYMETETAMKALFKLGKWITKKDDAAFAQELKSHLGYLRSKADDLGPYFSMIKSAASLFGKL